MKLHYPQILKQDYAFECPNCKQEYLVPSETPGIRYICPNDSCGYQINEPLLPNDSNYGTEF